MPPTDSKSKKPLPSTLDDLFTKFDKFCTEIKNMDQLQKIIAKQAVDHDATMGRMLAVVKAKLKAGKDDKVSCCRAEKAARCEEALKAAHQSFVQTYIASSKDQVTQEAVEEIAIDAFASMVAELKLTLDGCLVPPPSTPATVIPRLAKLMFPSDMLLWLNKCEQFFHASIHHRISRSGMHPST